MCLIRTKCKKGRNTRHTCYKLCALKSKAWSPLILHLNIGTAFLDLQVVTGFHLFYLCMIKQL